jgi:predicted nuclease of predicted toxin-antitoxin system
VKLLFDENLSRKLVARLGDLYPGSIHAASAGLLQSPDSEIWEFARAHKFVIVTADADFYQIAIVKGAPPKVVWLRGCDYPTRTVESMLRGQALRIFAFITDPNQSVLILRAR